MKKLISLLLLSAFVSCNPAFATDLKIPTAANYESGRFLCENKWKDLVSHENGFYTEVPLDYAHPEKGTTPIYAHFQNGFDPKKETLIYFSGGPGQTTHWGLFQIGTPFNSLLVEQRGIGCSRPNQVENYLSPEFYSSEFVARDAEVIRKSLGISKVTIYGISYGTIPATIYASLFPQATRALILEGTAFSGEQALWEAPHRRKLLQKMLDTLPEDIHKLLAQVSIDAQAPNTWLSQMSRDELMRNGGLSHLKENLLGLRNQDSYKSLVDQVKSNFEPAQVDPHPLFVTNDIPYFMVSCQELSLSNPQISTSDALIDGRNFVPVPDAESVARCAQLKASAKVTYEATNYPVSVPVTYFQGSDDGATQAPFAIHHYKEVPRGFAQLLILVKGGHNPNIQKLNMEDEGEMPIFEKAFEGSLIGKDLLDKANASSDLKWVMTAKNPKTN